eukprot:1279835-Alexandrium_andersonii.AAC.1
MPEAQLTFHLEPHASVARLTCEPTAHGGIAPAGRGHLAGGGSCLPPPGTRPKEHRIGVNKASALGH